MAFGETIYVSGSGSVGSGSITGLTSQQVVFGSASGGIGQNSSFVFDGTTLAVPVVNFGNNWTVQTTGSGLGIANLNVTVGSWWRSGATPSLILEDASTVGSLLCKGPIWLTTGTTAKATLQLQNSSNTGINWPSTARMDVLFGGVQVMSVTSNAFSVFTTTPQTQASSYTPSSTASGKTVLSTMSTAGTTNLTAWGFNSQAQILALVNGYNALSAVVSNLIADLKGFGFFA